MICNKEVSNTDFTELYKPRTPRNEVMDSVYADLEYALQNVRLNDGDQNVNRYVVAGFVSRVALTEGTWQKYYYQNILPQVTSAYGFASNENRRPFEPRNPNESYANKLVRNVKNFLR